MKELHEVLLAALLRLSEMEHVTVPSQMPDYNTKKLVIYCEAHKEVAQVHRIYSNPITSTVPVLHARLSSDCTLSCSLPLVTENQTPQPTFSTLS